MESNVEIKNIMDLIHALSLEGKLEIMNRLTREIRADVPTKVNENTDDLVDRLYGAWKDVDQSVFDEIIESRTVSDRDIDLDT